MNYREYKLKRAYDRLRELYTDKKLMRNQKFRIKNCPPKRAFDLGYSDGCIVKSTNVMCAKTEYGNITKVISIDDETGTSHETVVYTDNYMNTYLHTDIGLTRVRCGLMACLAADLNYPNIETGNVKVGFIGNGRINQETMKMLKLFFDIDSCVIRGSARDRAKNKDKFESICSSVKVDYTESLEILNQCDIIFCCTNSYMQEDMISRKQLNKPVLFIVQDSGYILDESFRNTWSIISRTDDEDQLVEHYRDEFPYDRRKKYFLTMKEDKSDAITKVIYLYGVAIADAIVFEEVFKEDVC